MSVHAYPLQSLLGDYIRAGAGVLFAVVPLFMVSSHSYVVYAFTGLLALFAGPPHLR